MSLMSLWPTTAYDLLGSVILFVSPILVMVAIFAAQRVLQQETTMGTQDDDINLIVERRYQALISDIMPVVEILVVASISINLVVTQHMNWLSNSTWLSNFNWNSGVWTSLAYVAFAVVSLCAFVLLHRTTHALAGAERNLIYRFAWNVGNLAFRLSRLLDLLRAHDRILFVRSTAHMLSSEYALTTTWSCFFLGWVVSMMQESIPSSSPRPRVSYLVASTILLPTVPPWVAYAVTSEHVLLLVTLKVSMVPMLVGVLLEQLQRRAVKHLLGQTVRNELALQLPPAARLHKGEALAAGEAPFSLADFEPVGILGFGGSAQVRLMRCKERSSGGSGKLVAIKSVFKKRGGRALDSSCIARVLEEQEILRAAHSHPFIVQLHDAFEDAHCFHLVLAYASNGPLSYWLINNPLEESVARLVGAEMLAGLAHLHSLGIVYRDLKPENVLVLGSGHVVLADFGVSKRLRRGDSEIGTKSLVGTPGYIAPEVLAQRKMSVAGAPVSPARLTDDAAPSDETDGAYSFSVDFWALGINLHILLTLNEPFQTHTIIELLDSSGTSELASAKLAALAEERLSDTLSPVARGLLHRLLVLNPLARLGAGKAGAREVMEHPFFDSIDWEALVRLELPPPLPNLGSVHR